MGKNRRRVRKGSAADMSSLQLGGLFVYEHQGLTSGSTHPSTNRARRCLASVSGREAVHASKFQRPCHQRVTFTRYTVDTSNVGYVHHGHQSNQPQTDN